LSYANDAPAGVKILGPVHGALFLAYVVIALNLRGPERWSNRTTFGVLLGAVLPFGGFVVDRWLAKNTQPSAA
jgi:integral membrane protein